MASGGRKKETRIKKISKHDRLGRNTFTALKHSLSDSLTGLSTGSDRIADIIIDDSAAGRKARYRRLRQESVSMVKGIADGIKRDMQGTSFNGVVRDTFYEAGKLWRMIKDALCQVCE